jgi:hypothetical protein
MRDKQGYRKRKETKGGVETEGRGARMREGYVFIYSRIPLLKSTPPFFQMTDSSRVEDLFWRLKHTDEAPLTLDTKVVVWVTVSLLPFLRHRALFPFCTHHTALGSTLYHMTLLSTPRLTGAAS